MMNNARGRTSIRMDVDLRRLILAVCITVAIICALPSIFLQAPKSLTGTKAATISTHLSAGHVSILDDYSNRRVTDDNLLETYNRHSGHSSITSTRSIPGKAWNYQKVPKHTEWVYETVNGKKVKVPVKIKDREIKVKEPSKYRNFRKLSRKRQIKSLRSRIRRIKIRERRRMKYGKKHGISKASKKRGKRNRKLLKKLRKRLRKMLRKGRGGKTKTVTHKRTKHGTITTKTIVKKRRGRTITKTIVVHKKDHPKKKKKSGYFNNIFRKNRYKGDKKKKIAKKRRGFFGGYFSKKGGHKKHHSKKNKKKKNYSKSKKSNNKNSKSKKSKSKKKYGKKKKDWKKKHSSKKKGGFFGGYWGKKGGSKKKSSEKKYGKKKKDWKKKHSSKKRGGFFGGYWGKKGGSKKKSSEKKKHSHKKRGGFFGGYWGKKGGGKKNKSSKKKKHSHKKKKSGGGGYFGHFFSKKPKIGASMGGSSARRLPGMQTLSAGRRAPGTSATKRSPGTTCACRQMKKRSRTSKCYFFTNKSGSLCASRECKASYECVQDNTTKIRCVRRKVTDRIVSTGWNKCKVSKVHEYMYVPYF